MPSALQTEKVAVRFRPEERHGLLESLGPDLQQYSGLGLAMVEKGWHVCLLKPDELKKLSLRLAGMLVTPPASRPIAWLTRAADRVMAAESGLSRKVEQRPREAGLTLAAISLCRPGESFPLPIELAHEAGFQEDNHDRQKEDADISARLHLLLMPYADHPLPELGGLAARDFARLIAADWLDGQSAFHLRRDLPPSLLEKTNALNRARFMLQAIAAREPLPADSLGRLPMGVVLSLLESPAWPHRGLHSGWSGNGLPSEAKVESVSATRALLEDAGLLKLSAGSFLITDLGRSLLRRAMMGELYTRLFEPRFRRGAGFGMRGSAAYIRFHRAMAYHLYRLAICPLPEWRSDDLADWVALPDWLYDLHPITGAAEFAGLLKQRFLAPLMDFGLLTIQQPAPGCPTSGRNPYKTTPLLQDLLGFDI